MCCDPRAESFSSIQSKDPANLERICRGQVRWIDHDVLNGAGHIGQRYGMRTASVNVIVTVDSPGTTLFGAPSGPT